MRPNSTLVGSEESGPSQLLYACPAERSDGGLHPPEWSTLAASFGVRMSELRPSWVWRVRGSVSGVVAAAVAVGAVAGCPIPLVKRWPMPTGIEERSGSFHESDCGDGVFVAQCFGVGQAGVAVDRGVQVDVSRFLAALLGGSESDPWS